jgi:hypothetical protein
MQQRRLRLGDILDDYCPRERRVTNHAVVAMIDDQVKQTRCTTCDADHEYKGARVPVARRRKDGGALSDMPDDAPRAVRPADAVDDDDVLVADALEIESPDSAEPEPLADAIAVADAAAADDDPPDVVDDEGPVHRPLIRATLPRPEGQLPEWKEPEFTIRQPGRDGNRGGGQGQRQGGGGGGGRHRRPMRNAGGPMSGGTGQSRFGGPRPSGPRHGSGQRPPQGQGQGQPNGNRSGGQPGGSRGAGRSGDQRGPGRKRGR